MAKVENEVRSNAGYVGEFAIKFLVVGRRYGMSDLQVPNKLKACRIPLEFVLHADRLDFS